LELVTLTANSSSSPSTVERQLDSLVAQKFTPVDECIICEDVTRNVVSCVIQLRTDRPFFDGISSFSGTLTTTREYSVTIGD